MRTIKGWMAMAVLGVSITGAHAGGVLTNPQFVGYENQHLKLRLERPEMWTVHDRVEAVSISQDVTPTVYSSDFVRMNQISSTGTRDGTDLLRFAKEWDRPCNWRTTESQGHPAVVCENAGWGHIAILRDDDVVLKIDYGYSDDEHFTLLILPMLHSLSFLDFQYRDPVSR